MYRELDRVDEEYVGLSNTALLKEIEQTRASARRLETLVNGGVITVDEAEYRLFPGAEGTAMRTIQHLQNKITVLRNAMNKRRLRVDYRG